MFILIVAALFAAIPAYFFVRRQTSIVRIVAGYAVGFGLGLVFAMLAAEFDKSALPGTHASVTWIGVIGAALGPVLGIAIAMNRRQGAISKGSGRP